MQACGLRDIAPQADDVQIVGISPDSPETQVKKNPHRLLMALEESNE